jgi:gentisate 1,2-dioxygenase
MTLLQVNLDAPDAISRQLREAMRKAHIVPLWESPIAHKPERRYESAQIWPWREVAPILDQSATIVSPAVVERRVLSLINPKPVPASSEATTGGLSASLQMLLPGERARPHRHSMDALRFVLQGSGAETIVDGKSCPMSPGDLIITPAWCWHEHVSTGAEPTIWVDVLDFALHLSLGTFAYEPGPAPQLERRPDDAIFSVANTVPSGLGDERPHSPVFRYPLANVIEALGRAPIDRDGARRVRYVNPLSGRPAMALLDCTMVEIDKGPTRPFRMSASTVCVAVEGQGVSEIGNESIEWKPNDVFTLPQGQWVSHRAVSDIARIFMASNREVYGRLGLLDESYGALVGATPAL